MGIPASLGVGASGQPPAGDQASAVVTGSFGAVGPGLPFAMFGQCNAALFASVNTTLTTTALSSNCTVASGAGLAAGCSIKSANVPPGTTLATLVGVNGTLAFPTQTYFGTLTANGRISGLPTTAGLQGATVSGPGIPAGTTVSAILTPAVSPPSNSNAQPTPGVVQLSALPTSVPVNNSQQAFAFALTNACVTGGADAAAVFTGASAAYVGSVQLERSFDGGSTWICANVGGGGALAQYSAGTPVSLAFGEPEKNVLYRWNCTAYTSGTINYRLSQTGMAALSLGVGAQI